jgi:esterase/lipase superfamily enzyme
MPKAKSKKQRPTRAARPATTRRRSPVLANRLGFVAAGEIVQEAIPRGPHDINSTLEDIGLTTAAKRGDFRHRVVVAVARRGYSIRATDIPHEARTTLREVRTALANLAMSAGREPRTRPRRLPPKKAPTKGRGGRLERSGREASAARPTLDEPEYAVVKVYFGTDRNKTGDAEPSRYFGGKRGALTYGVTEVSIPRDHRMGALESPALWRLEFRKNPARHVVLLRLEPLDKDAFVMRLRAGIETSPQHDALMFVHGYNVSFEDAARRTAQITYDLGFGGIPLLYSWPSEGATLRYTVDENNVRWTLPHFTDFLTLALTELRTRVVHVIAHSMGNRCLTEMLRTFDATSLGAGAAVLGQIVFAAPDIDSETFIDLAREFRRQAARFTLYASSTDRALQASKAVNGYPRAGDAGPGLVIADGIDTIDATLVDTNLMGHSYIGENDSILGDVFDLLKDGHAPEERFRLAPRQRAGRRYWYFKP